MASEASTIVRVHEMDAIICSPTMAALMAMVARVGPSDAAVLITGETGTGKEVVARAVHTHSRRNAKPWVDVNCAALPEHLVESELFGYEKGAFSGADTPKQGLFELADRGTLFLDEIGDLDRKVQVKLLRVLDGTPYYRLGGSRKVSVDVRIIAASNQPLDQMVKQGGFRSDLYHRLSQVQLRVPPLRERPEDVAALAHYFLDQMRPGLQLSPAALEVLQAFSWPGNVRELKNIVLQSALNVRGDEIQVADLPPELRTVRLPPPAEGSLLAAFEPGAPTAALDDLERQAIVRALAHTAGHQGQAAEQLGISRRTLSRKLKQYRLERRGYSLGALSPSEQQYYRASIAVPVAIGSRRGEETVQTMNLSTGGMAIEGVQNPFQFTGEVTLAFSIPGLAAKFSARAQVVWSDANGRAGLRFTALEGHLARRLSGWLQEKQAEEGWSPQPAPEANLSAMETSPPPGKQ
jgi:DNA-binding NtrC family response regulator